MKGLERIIADLELELAGAEAVASGIRGALKALRGEREPKDDAPGFSRVEVTTHGDKPPTFVVTASAQPGGPFNHPTEPLPLAGAEPWFPEPPTLPTSPKGTLSVAPKKRRGRPPKAKPAEKSEVEEKPKRSKMISHLCHKCNNRTEWDPCHRCGAKVRVVSSLATMAPDIAHADVADA